MVKCLRVVLEAASVTMTRKVAAIMLTGHE